MLRRVMARGFSLFPSSRLRRIERAAVAAEHLARLDALDMILARSEGFARELLPCDAARVTIGLGGSDIAADGTWSDTLRIAMPAPGGGRLGWITAARRDGPPFSPDDEAAFEQLARSVTLAVRMGLHKAEAAAARTEAETLLTRVSDGIAEFDRDLHFLSINEAAVQALRIAHLGDVAGVSLWDLGPGNGAGEFGALCQTALDTDRPVWATGRFVALKSCFELRAFPHSHGLTLLFRDVTAQRVSESRLRHSRRLEAVGQLTGGVAHDVNNLLTVMLGNLETLAARAQDRAGGSAATAIAAAPRDVAPDADTSLALAGLRAGESAARLIRRLLAYSRGQPSMAQPVDVATLLRSLEPMLQRTLGSRIPVRLKCAAALWPAVADPAEFESAILNMVLNAQDAMPNGGVLEIAAENVEVDRLYAKVGGFERTGAYVMLTVVDNGAGMTPETMRQVFEPFFTTKEPDKGTGLGLSMVHGFARQAGGHVIIDSEPGQGTILRVYLPRSRETATVSTSGAVVPLRQHVFPSEGHEHVLVVEDNTLVRVHAETMLRSLGYGVTAAADGNEAMELLGSGLRPDLLFTDVVLPGAISGLRLAQAAVELRPGLPVLFTSGYSYNTLLREGRLLSDATLLTKPFRRTDLAAAVRSQLDVPARRVPRL